MLINNRGDVMWKPVVGYEGIYEVRPGEDGGAVRRVRPIKRSYVGRILRTKGGHYPRVVLSKDKKSKCYRVHTLILEAFIGPKPKGFEACHKDDNGWNNSLKNLYWGSRSDNVNDCLTNGNHISISKKMSYRHGNSHPNTVISDELVLEVIKKRSEGCLLKELSKEYGVSEATISRCCRGGRYVSRHFNEEG